MASTRDLESQAETERSQIAATLDELRSRMSTGQMVDQALSYVRGHGGTEFMRTLGDQVKTDPLPIALVAAGLGWLMVGQRRPEARTHSPSIVPDEMPYDQRFTEKARETSGEVAGALRDSTQAAAERARSVLAGARDSTEQATSSAFDTMVSARDRAQGAATTAGESLSSAYDAASGAAGRASSAVSDTAAALSRRTYDVRDRVLDVGRNTASRARQASGSVAEQAGRAQNTISRLIHEQPVIVGAIGLAIGAVIGASLPRSRQEDEPMGEASESLKAAAEGIAREQFARAQEAGGRIVEKVRSAAEDQGLTSESAQSFVRDIGAKVSEVAAAAKQGAEDELQSAKQKAEAEMPESSYGQDDWSQSHEDAHVHEAAGPERFSEAAPNELPSGSGTPAQPQDR